jgi:hypothetical protein
MEGWVKFYRKYLASPIWRNPNHNVSRMADACLLMANHLPARLSIGGEVLEINPGQFWTSQESLEKVTGLSRQQIRTSIAILIKLDFLTIKSTKQGSLISIINWGIYQSPDMEDNQQPNQRVTNDQPTSNHKQEYKNDKKKKLREDIPGLFKIKSPGGQPSTQPREKADGQQIWACWVDANRAAGRPDPVREGPNLASAKALAKLVDGLPPPGFTMERMKKALAFYLAFKDDPFIVKQGHPLRLLKLTQLLNAPAVPPQERPRRRGGRAEGPEPLGDALDSVVGVRDDKGSTP